MTSFAGAAATGSACGSTGVDATASTAGGSTDPGAAAVSALSSVDESSVWIGAELESADSVGIAKGEAGVSSSVDIVGLLSYGDRLVDAKACNFWEH